jgi:HEPN domain-containing protein
MHYIKPHEIGPESYEHRLLEAEYAINNQTKVRLAIEAAELALKALLIKKGLFTEDAITHNLSYLFDKLILDYLNTLSASLKKIR